MKPIGVLALQGDFEAHQAAVRQAGVGAVQVRTTRELEQVAGLIIPGGESTTMWKLLASENLLEPLRLFGLHRPIFGTCAGAILLAAEVSSPFQDALGLVDLAITRNAYGRQLASRVVRLAPEPEFIRRLGDGDLEAVFIRAPIIRRVGPGVTVLLRYHGDPVLVEQGRHLVATFHPELSLDRRVHQLFLRKVGP